MSSFGAAVTAAVSMASPASFPAFVFLRFRACVGPLAAIVADGFVVVVAVKLMSVIEVDVTFIDDIVAL